MKYNRPERAASLRSSGRRARRRWRAGRARSRGVSEVVATIILLAMTVVLFSSIFAWVTSFPTPAPQNVTQFSASFVLTANGTYVQDLQISHLAGPSVAGTTQVYLKSAYYPQAPEFANPITAAAYLPNHLTWNLGQSFNYPFPTSPFQLPKLPDNITILLVSNDQLIYSTILPGTPVAVPPNFVSTDITPDTPAVGASFTVSAVVAGNTGGNTVYVALANLPGLSALYPVAQKMTYSAATNQWTFTVPASETNANGTYYAFVNVTNNMGQSATAGVAVTLVSSGGGGGTSSILSVAVGLSTIPVQGSATLFIAYVTYTGAAAGAALNVTFYANRTTGSTGVYTPFVGNGPSGTTITGPSTVSIFSTTRWLVPSLPGSQTFTVTARATVAGVGQATGFYTYTLPLGLGHGTFTAAASHLCTYGTSCP